MINKWLKCFFLVFVSCSCLFGLEPAKSFPTIDAVEFKLDNGMVVCLKPTKNEVNDVQIKFGALGGYSVIAEQERPSAQIAAEAAWQSGTRTMTTDQFSVYLYEHSLEFEPKILPFSRIVDGVALSETVEFFFKCIQMLFTEQQFSEEGWNAAQKEMKIVTTREANDYDHVFEAKFLQFNTDSLPALKPMTVDDLAKANFTTAKEFFQRCFKNPSEFVCIVVGDIDTNEVMRLAKKYLGVIPQQSPSRLNMPISAPFPKGISKTKIQLGKQPSCLTKLTFPLLIKVEESNIQIISFISQVIEARLKRTLTEKMKHAYGIDVSYDFPVYPYLNNPWISIRYRCETGDSPQIKETLLQELARLFKDGVSSKEIESVKILELGSQEFWQNDNLYWVSMLLNYYLWGWNPEGIDYRNNPIKSLSKSQVDQFLKLAISLEHFSEFTAFPE